jgi:hypothetical protein
MGNRCSDYYGLIFNCPIGFESLDCGYKRIRQLPLKERISYVNVLTEAEKKNLVKKHQKCLLVREKKTLFHESQ